MKNLKLLFIIVIITIFGKNAIAQGNLQFNQVKTFIDTFTTITYNTPSVISIVTVPLNKVWKIEFFSTNIYGAIFGNNSGLISSLAINNIGLVYNSNSNKFC